jgi:hypothetical protein
MNRPALASSLTTSVARLVITVCLLVGVLAPMWVLYLGVFRTFTNVRFEYRALVPLTAAFLLPLLATHFYFRRLQALVRWEIWFGALQLVGWAAAAWSFEWMTQPQRLERLHAQTGLHEAVHHLAIGSVSTCFVAWLITPVVCCLGRWTWGITKRWRKRSEVDSANALVSHGGAPVRKTINLRTVAVWVTLLSIGLSLIFSRGKLVERLFENQMGRRAVSIWGNSVWSEAAWISANSIVIYCLMNLWLKRFKPYSIGVLAILTLMPALPFLMPVALVQLEVFEGTLIYSLCWLLFLVPCALIVWRWALSVVAPNQAGAETTELTTERNAERIAGWSWLGMPIFFRWVVIAVTFGWVCLLASIPFTHYFFASGDGSVEVLRRQMVEVYGGDPAQEVDWLDGLNRSMRSDLAPKENAIVDLIELRLERLAVLKNATGGMETLREYFQKLGVPSETAEDWLLRLKQIDPPSEKFSEMDYISKPIIDLIAERQNELLTTRQGRTWYGLDKMVGGNEDMMFGGQASRELPSREGASASLDVQPFKIDLARIRELKSERDIVKAYLAGNIKLIRTMPWTDEDAPLAAKLLKQNRDRLKALRQLSKKKHFSPWIRLKCQHVRENQYGNDSRRPYNPAILVIDRDLGWLEISLMNHAGNEDFDAAISDLHALARLYDRSWLVEFEMPTWRVGLINASVRRVRAAAILLACHPRFPIKRVPELRESVRSLPTIFDDGSKELINLRANLTADFFQRSEGSPFGFDDEFLSVADEPMFAFGRKFPYFVDWRPLANLIDRIRREAIEKCEKASVTNRPVFDNWRQENPGTITETYFQSLFLTGPTGKGVALAKMLDDTHSIRLLDKYRKLTHLEAVLDETGLCLELFQKTQGRYPASLSELVPEFLQMVPQDPLSKTGQSLIYRLQNEAYTLYSIGSNRVDDGGDQWQDEVFKRPAVNIADFIKRKVRF